MSLSKKKWQSITQGKSFCAIPETAQFIKLLSQYLKEDKHTVVNYKDDANTQTVEAALDIAFEKNNVTVFAEEHKFTLLLYFWNSGM